MDKLTFKEWYTLSDLQTIVSLKEDEEFSMARGELKTAKSAIERLMRHLKGEGNLEAWVQSKITKASEYLDTVADHMDSGEDETKHFKEEFKSYKSVKEISKKHKVSPSKIEKQLEMGMEVEKEHTTNSQLAKEIALQHLDEFPDYYSKLKKVEKVQEMISTSAQTGRTFRSISSKDDQQDLEKERAKNKKEKQEKYKKSLDHLRDETRKKGVRFYDKKGSGYIKDGQKQYDEGVEILDANGNLFAHVVDLIKGSDDRFKGFTQPITEDAVKELEDRLKKLDNTSYDSIDKLMRGIMKEHGMTAKELHNAFVNKHDKTPDDWIKELKEEKGLWDNIHARRKKGLPRKKPGEKGYPKTLNIEEGIKQARKNVGASKCWSDKKLGNPPTKMKGGKEVPNCVPMGESNEVVRYCPKCKKKETAKECRYGEKYWKMFSIPASLDSNPYDPNEIHPSNESIIQPGQLTTEDYQRIQSTGNVYTILFSWRARPMMNLQLFFPNMKRPSKEEVKIQVEKLYPGAIIMQWHPSPTDPSKPIVVIQK